MRFAGHSFDPESICFLIGKIKKAVVFANESLSPGEDQASLSLADHAEDLSFQGFKAAAVDLEPLRQTTMLALM